jgi:manganese transport protein
MLSEINSAIVIMAAACSTGTACRCTGIEEADRLLKPLLGQVAPAAFGIALLASGLSSSAVGTMAGQMIVDAIMRWRVCPCSFAG